MHTLRELPRSDQPIARLRDGGPTSLSVAELLELIVGLPCGRELLVYLGGIEGLLRVSLEQVSAFPGIGEAKAARVLAAVELGRRALSASDQQRKEIRSASEAAEIFLAKLSGELQEHVVVMLLDGHGGLMALETVHVGVSNSTLTRMAEVMRQPILQGATSIIVGHNHPSGDVSPSNEDLQFSRQLVQAGEMLDIEILDHIIVSSSGNWRWLSLKERGLGRL